MRSPTAALLWEIWRQHRSTLAAIGVVTVVGRLVDYLDTHDGAGADPSPLPIALAMLAFLLLLAVFNYTEPSGNRGLGRFPRRLFTLPVTSLRLVTVPLLAGIAAIELLYLFWLGPLSRGGTVSLPFVAVLLAALIVFYLWALWTLERAGSIRLFMLGGIAIALFVVGMLPSFPPTPPPAWRSEIVVGALVAGLAVVAFLLAWRHVAGLRAGGGRSARRAESVFEWIADASPRRRRSFASAVDAQVWFEWRSSGVVLPTLIAGYLLVAIMPLSWIVRGNEADTLRLLLATLAAPVLLAVPVGIAFSKPAFWSDDLAVPAFIAVRPVSSEELVAIKVKVAAMSAGLTWLVIVVFLGVWLSMWGNLDGVRQLAVQLLALQGRSTGALLGIALLVSLAGMFWTWRFMVSRLWSGLSGKQPLLMWSVVSLVVVAIAVLVSGADRLPGWLLADRTRLGPLAWIAGVAVIAKYSLAVYTWRGLPPRYVRAYLLIWLAGTAAFVALVIAGWGVARVHLPSGVDHLRSVLLLLALLVVPLVRVGLAPSSLARNRHRS